MQLNSTKSQQNEMGCLLVTNGFNLMIVYIVCKVVNYFLFFTVCPLLLHRKKSDVAMQLKSNKVA